jgi:purine-nucleoside phosphorylase
LITNLSYKPNIVCIGTSRSLQISSSFFENKKFINCSFSHGNIKDFIATIGLLDSCDKLPTEIYLETSSTLINSSDTYEWESIYQYYLYEVSKLKVSLDNEPHYFKARSVKKKVEALFSLAYFQKSFSGFFTQKSSNFKDVGILMPSNFGRLADFSITYPKSYKNPDTLKAMSDAEIFVSKNTIPEIGNAELKVLKNILKYLKSKNVKITLLNIPFQHDCYNIFENKNKAFIGISEDIKRFAIEMNVSLVGTLNPYEAGINRGEFFDQLHCSQSALRKVFKIIQYTPTQSSPFR